MERDRLNTRLAFIADGLDKHTRSATLEQIYTDIEKRMADLLASRSAVYEAIDSVNDERCRTLLRLRYLERLSPLQVSMKLYLCQRQYYRLQNKALNSMTVPTKRNIKNSVKTV